MRTVARRVRASIALAAVVPGLLGGCAWRWPWSAAKPTAATAGTAVPAPAPVDVRPASEMRVACPNTEQAMADARFPRAAIIRGLDAGHASVRFAVEGATLTIVSVTSSDPAFADEAVATVRRFTCRAERPAVFEVPFDWRSAR